MGITQVVLPLCLTYGAMALMPRHCGAIAWLNMAYLIWLWVAFPLQALVEQQGNSCFLSDQAFVWWYEGSWEWWHSGLAHKCISNYNHALQCPAKHMCSCTKAGKCFEKGTMRLWTLSTWKLKLLTCTLEQQGICQSWPEPYFYTVYDRMYGVFPALVPCIIGNTYVCLVMANPTHVHICAHSKAHREKLVTTNVPLKQARS